MKKVKTTIISGAHNLSQCQDCDWAYDGVVDGKNIDGASRGHVRKTGHVIVRESVRNIKYYLDAMPPLTVRNEL